MSKRKLNIELLTKVRDRIRDIPESYCQGWWAKPDPKAPCGTACCIAGETVICAAPTLKIGIERINRMIERNDESAAAMRAQRLLKIDDREAAHLFSGLPDTCWPEPFCSQWDRAKHSKTKAKIAVRFLTRIIERGHVLD